MMNRNKSTQNILSNTHSHTHIHINLIKWIGYNDDDDDDDYKWTKWRIIIMMMQRIMSNNSIINLFDDHRFMQQNWFHLVECTQENWLIKLEYLQLQIPVYMWMKSVKLNPFFWSNDCCCCLSRSFFYQLFWSLTFECIWFLYRQRHHHHHHKLHHSSI